MTPTLPVVAPEKKQVPAKTRSRPGKGRFLRAALQVILSMGVLAGGYAVAAYLIATKPKARQRKATAHARLVDVTTVSATRERVMVQAMGTVCAARAIDLQPRVSGEVVKVNTEFVPGGRFETGQTLLRIDPADYELAVRQRAAEVAQAESNLKLELGQRSVAKREYEMLGKTVKPEDRELVLREPQLASQRATLASAKAALEKARLDLARTTVKAPFNAIVKSRGVNLGARVSTSTQLATLVGTDEYWVEAAVPVDRLKWIHIPRTDGDKGSMARVYNEAAWGAGVFRTGRVSRLAGDLESDGRMARVLVTVEDPISLRSENAGRPVLLIDSYVRLEIEGVELDGTVRLGRDLVRDGDRVWVMTADGTLAIRKVTVAFRGRDHVLVAQGLRSGEQVVATDLATPVEGMPLRTGDVGKSPQGQQSPAARKEGRS